MRSKNVFRTLFFDHASVPLAASAGPLTKAKYSPDHALQNQQCFDAASQNSLMKSSSTNAVLEESGMITRDVRNQMALQNKIRAFKQQELNKYKNSNNSQRQVVDHEVQKEKLPVSSESQASPITSIEKDEESKVSEAASRVKGV